jgi:hypothetical protein
MRGNDIELESFQKQFACGDSLFRFGFGNNKRRSWQGRVPETIVEQLSLFTASRFRRRRSLASTDVDSPTISVDTVRMTLRIPKEQDRVTVEGHAGVLTVVDVHEQAQTVDLRYVTGDGPVVEGIAWTSLKYMDDGEAAAEGT